jgi:CBS domain-containing protein
MPRTRPVSEIARKEFRSVAPDERLDLADDILRIGHFRHLPVLQDGRLVGMLSTRDVLKAALTSLLDFDPEQRKTFLHAVEVAEVMTSEVVSISSDATCAAAAVKMLESKIGCLPVVAEDGTVEGLVTESDLLAAAYLG